MEAVNATLLKELLVIAGALVVVVSAIVGIWRRSPGLPQPVVTQRATEFVTRQQHQDHLEAERRRIGALESRMDRVEEKMDADKQEIISAIDQKVVRLEEKLDAMPSRVIAILKDTKGLIGRNA